VGSFTDVVMSFDFRPDTPPEVLAAFSALALPLPPDAYWGPPPELADPVIESSELWNPDWRESRFGEEAFPDEPWRHNWAPHLSGSASVGTVPHAALVWSQSKLWNLSFRTSFKTWADAVFAFLEWLGPFIYAFNEDYPLLIGYLNDDAEGRPRLLWFKDRELTLEDLNTDETRYG
jgi:hypothetical protein